MDEILNVYDFYYEGCKYPHGVANLSRHCNLTPSDSIIINSYLIPFAGLTFPKVVHATHLDLSSAQSYINMYEAFPDLKSVGFFEGGRGQIDDFGHIIKINHFKGMQQYLDTDKRKYHPYVIKTTCEPLGDDMYRFTSDKGSWDIRVNRYN